MFANSFASAHTVRERVAAAAVQSVIEHRMLSEMMDDFPPNMEQTLEQQSMFARPYNAGLLLLLASAPSCIPLGGLLMMDAHSRRRRIKRAKRSERSRDETTRLESPTNPETTSRNWTRTYGMRIPTHGGKIQSGLGCNHTQQQQHEAKMLVIGFFSRALIRASLKSSYTLERANEKSRLAVAIFFCSAGKKPQQQKESVRQFLAIPQPSSLT